MHHAIIKCPQDDNDEDKFVFQTHLDGYLITDANGLVSGNGGDKESPAAKWTVGCVLPTGLIKFRYVTAVIVVIIYNLMVNIYIYIYIYIKFLYSLFIIF